MEVLYSSGMKLIGRTFDGERVFVEAELRLRQGEHQTTEHQQVNGYTELGITGEVFHKHARTGYSFGQCHDSLATVEKPHGALTLEDVAKLYAIWRRWHLNGLRAGCAHMPRDAHEKWKRREPVVCEQSGYSYGSAWLAEALPDEVQAAVRSIMDRNSVR